MCPIVLWDRPGWRILYVNVCPHSASILWALKAIKIDSSIPHKVGHSYFSQSKLFFFQTREKRNACVVCDIAITVQNTHIYNQEDLM